MKLIAKCSVALVLLLVSACAPDSNHQSANSPSEAIVLQFDSANAGNSNFEIQQSTTTFEENLFAARRAKSRISGGRCESSLHCPGSSVCIANRCTNSSEGGDRCTSSLHCGGSSVCLGGRCTATSGQAPSRHCESSLHCAGSSVCIGGQCTNSGSQGNSCSSSLHCSGSSVCLGGRCT